MTGCEDHREAIGALLDGELPPHQVADLCRHLEGCAGCRGVLAETAALRAELHSLADPAPAALAARIEAMIAAPARPRWRVRAAWRPTAWASAGALAAAALLLTLLPRAHTAAELMAVRDAALRPAAGVIAAAYEPQGYQLVSSRIDVVAGHRARVFIFQRGSELVALCEWDANGEPAHTTRKARQGDTEISYWNDGTTEFWAAGKSAELAGFVGQMRGKI